MCEDLVKKIYHISKKYNAENIAVMTGHFKIKGKLAHCDGDERSDYILTLTDAKTWLLQDLCKCSDQKCGCEAPYICHSDWININSEKIVSFTVY